MKKAFTILLICISILLVAKVIILIAFLNPVAPLVITKIDGNDFDTKESFHSINEVHWNYSDGKLHFNNSIDDIQKISLFSDQLPTEGLKEGYITSKVTVNSNFDEIEDNSFYGFIIGEADTTDDAKLFLGMSGMGQIVILSGNLETLKSESVKYGNGLSTLEMEEVVLSIHYYKNPFGWILFYNILDANTEEYLSRSIINHIPSQKLDSDKKELALTVYNPNLKGNIWFKEWQIQNDWTPND